MNPFLNFNGLFCSGFNSADKQWPQLQLQPWEKSDKWIDANLNILMKPQKFVSTWFVLIHGSKIPLLSKIRKGQKDYKQSTLEGSGYWHFQLSQQPTTPQFIQIKPILRQTDEMMPNLTEEKMKKMHYSKPQLWHLLSHFTPQNHSSYREKGD